MLRDHLSAGEDVLRCREVKHVWQSGKQVDTEVFASFEQAARAEPDAELHEPPAFGAGSIIELGAGARATVLSVRPDASDTNDASIVLRLDLGATRVLLTGDATAGKRRAPHEPPDPGSVEAELVDVRASELAADVLVVGHHGSKTSTRAAFLDAVSPRFALISSGPQKYGSVVLPDPEIVGLLEQRSIIVLRTDEDDDACRAAADKVGPDADGSPGGCSAKTLRLGSTVEVAPSPTKD